MEQARRHWRGYKNRRSCRKFWVHDDTFGTDTASAAQKIVDLLNDPDRRRAFGVRNRDRAQAAFSVTPPWPARYGGNLRTPGWQIQRLSKVALFVHCFFPDHFYGTETYTLQGCLVPDGPGP